MTALRSRISRVLDDVGIPAATKFQLRQLAHRAGVREDPLARVAIAADKIGASVREDPPTPRPGETVLVWAIRGGLLQSTVESLLPKALHVRGIPTITVQCHGILPGCEGRSEPMFARPDFGDAASKPFCNACSFTSHRLSEAVRAPMVALEALLAPGAREAAEAETAGLSANDAFHLARDGYELGPIVHSSVVRFFMRTDLDVEDPLVILQARRYAAAALIMLEASKEAIRRYRPRAILTTHAIYVTWGILAEVAKREGIPFTVWAQGFRSGTVLLGKDATYFEELQKEPVSAWETLDLDERGRRERLDRYLSTRWTPATDAITLFQDSIRDPERVRAELALDPSRRSIALFPNVTWDAQVNHRNIAFESVASWVLASIEIARERPEVQFILRAHPMEKAGMSASRETILGIVAKHVRDVPANVRVLPPESPINSYALAEIVDAAAVHATQLGLELAARGIPVIVSGGPPYRAKGFTVDVDDVASYRRAIDAIEPRARIGKTEQERALQYAYHYYFRRMIPLGLVEMRGRSEVARVIPTSIDDLRPGRHAGLDRVVDAILDKAPPVFEE